MLRLFKVRAMQEREDSGTIIILMTFVFIVLLAMSGLAIDAGNLYRSQQTLQKAADAGALAAIGYSMQLGEAKFNEEVETRFGAGNEKMLLDEKAIEIVLSNLADSGLPQDLEHPVSIVTEYTSTPSSNVAFNYSVNVDRPVDFLLMHLVPLPMLGLGATGRGRTLAANAVSQRKIANVALLLDFSDSMACPASGDCLCLTPARTGPCSSPSKLDRLLDAVVEFLKNFDPNNDKILLVPFNTTARNFTLDELATDPVIQGEDVEEIVENLKLDPGVGGNTNFCDAMMQAYGRMQTLAPDQEVSYVLFSDGAPTAGRFLFSSPAGIKPWDPSGFGAYDYQHYTVQWYDSSGHRPGPSVLSQTGLLQMEHSGAAIPGSGDGVSSPAVADCGPASAPPVASIPQTATAADEVFAGCLGDLGFHMPQSAGTEYGVGGAGDPDFVSWRKQYYHCAVQLSDFLREHRGTVHAIGLGEDTTLGADPFQDIDDNSSRKDILMSRIANDYIQGVMRPQQAATPWNHPEFTFSGYSSYDALNSKASPRQGRYLATPDSEELERLFQSIARKILLSLVE